MMDADLILVNGGVTRLSKINPQVSAVAIKDRRFLGFERMIRY
jgi:predicted amidohydrolase YtcJ